MPTVIETRVSDHLVCLETKTPPTRLDNRLQTGTYAATLVDVVSLERELRASIEGEVQFSDGERGMYASDAGSYRMVPIGVVLPRDADDVLAALAAYRRDGLARGAHGPARRRVPRNAVRNPRTDANRTALHNCRDRRSGRGDTVGNPAAGLKILGLSETVNFSSRLAGAAVLTATIKKVNTGSKQAPPLLPHDNDADPFDCRDSADR
jgi:hypothetical protein